MNRDFLITMGDSCLLTSMGWCVCGYGADIKKCDGELADRPKWCPLVPVEDRGPNLENKKVWVEK